MVVEHSSASADRGFRRSEWVPCEAKSRLERAVPVRQDRRRIASYDSISYELLVYQTRSRGVELFSEYAKMTVCARRQRLTRHCNTVVVVPSFHQSSRGIDDLLCPRMG